MDDFKKYILRMLFSFLICLGIQNNTIFGMIASLDINNPQHKAIQDEKPVLIFDLDDTVIDVDTLGAYPAILWKSLPWNFFTLLGLKSNRKQNKYGVSKFKAKNSEELAPGGGATSLSFYALYGNTSETFQKLVPEMLDITWKNAEFMPGAKTLLDYLKAKEYPIVYATNKDYTSYVHVAETLDKKYDNAFSTYPKLILVTQPQQVQLDEWAEKIKKSDNGTNNNNNFVPENFRTLIQEICEAKEDPAKHIYFVHGYEKPEALYYERLKKLIKAEGLDTINKLIFFDDKEINITGAKAAEISGYTIKTVADIVVGLERENILDPAKDQGLYLQLEREGVFGFLRKIACLIRNIQITKAATN